MERDKLRTLLQAQKADLETPSEDIAPVELDQQSVGRLSRMDAMQVQAMALAAEQRRKAELARVKAALERIDSDEFGFCEICGEEIAAARLEHNPAVTRCIGCAS